MTYVDRPLPATLELPRLVDRPRDKRLDNLRRGPGTGRSKGLQNKICRDLKEGLLQGAILHGYDGEGEDGLIGYCHHLAERHPKAYCGLLAKLLPLNLNANVATSSITSVNIISVPTDNYLSAEDIERMRGPMQTVEQVPQAEPERFEEPAPVEDYPAKVENDAPAEPEQYVVVSAGLRAKRAAAALAARDGG